MPTLRSALLAYLSVDRAAGTNLNYRRVLTEMITAVGPDRDVGRVSHEDLTDYFQQVRGRDLRPSTLVNYVRMWKSFFNFCVRQQHIDRSPAAGLVVRKAQRRPGSRAIPPHELKAMIDAARYHPRNFAIMLFLSDTGCRVGGLASLTLENLNLKEGSAYLKEKGGRWHHVWFGPKTGEALQAWLRLRRQTGHDYVFTSTGKTANPLGVSGIAYVVKGLARAVGATKVWGPHAIRHSVGHALAQRGVPITITQQILGHSTPETTMRFYYPDDESMVRDASRKYSLAALEDNDGREAAGSAEKPTRKTIHFSDFVG